MGEGQRDKEEEGGGEKKRKMEGVGGTKRKLDDDTCGPGPGPRVDKTPRRSPGSKKHSPPGPKLKPKHKEAPHIRGAVGDIRKWLAKPHREGRDLEDKCQERNLQPENNLGPKVLLEIKDRRPSSKLAPERLVEDPRKDQSQRPPPSGTIQNFRNEQTGKERGKEHRIEHR